MAPEDYARMHQRAFRTAFDFLSSHFPPENSEEWWMRATAEISEVSAGVAGNKLAMELLAGVWEYLYQENERRQKTVETVES